MAPKDPRRSEAHARTPASSWRQKASRWAIPVGGSTAAVIAALMIAAPMAGASSSITWSSPFSHLVKTVDTGTFSSGCYSYANLPVDPTVDPVSGAFSGWDRAATGTCSSTPSYVNAEAWGDLQLQGFKFTGASSGWATVSVSFQLNWSARATVSGGNDSSAWAGSSAILESWVYDTSASSYSNASSVTIWDSGVSSGTVFGHSHGQWYTLNYTVPVTPGHSLQVAVALYTYADSWTDGGGTSWAEFDFGATGLGGSLSSVTVS